MRKFILLVFFIVLFAVPVSAAEANDNNFVNVLDYSSFDSDGDNFFSVNGTKEMIVSLPAYDYVRYVDLLVLTSGGSFDVTAGVGTYAQESLTVEQINNNYYRVYGEMTFRRGSEIKFIFTTTSLRYLEILQFRYASELANSFDIEAYCQINTGDYNSTIHYVPTDTINNRSWVSDTDIENSFYQLFFWVEDWRKYDYIDVQLFLDVASIQSISGSMGGDNIDLDVSWIGGQQWDSNMYFVTIGIDCTQFNRSIDDDPMVVIEGNVKYQTTNGVAVSNVCGKIFRNQLNNLAAYFSKLESWIQNQTSSLISSFNSNFSNLSSWIQAQTDSIESAFTSLNSKIDTKFSNLNTWIKNQTTAIVDAINGDTSPGEQFQDELSSRNEELEEMSVIMDSVPKPDIDNISFDIQVDNSIQYLSSSLGYIMSSSIFSNLFIMCFILALAAYILYGKR